MRVALRGLPCDFVHPRFDVHLLLSITRRSGSMYQRDCGRSSPFGAMNNCCSSEHSATLLAAANAQVAQRGAEKLLSRERTERGRIAPAAKHKVDRIRRVGARARHTGKRGPRFGRAGRSRERGFFSIDRWYHGTCTRVKSIEKSPSIDRSPTRSGWAWYSSKGYRPIVLPRVPPRAAKSSRTPPKRKTCGTTSSSYVRTPIGNFLSACKAQVSLRCAKTAWLISWLWAGRPTASRYRRVGNSYFRRRTLTTL